MERNEKMKFLKQMMPKAGNIFGTEVPKHQKYDPKFQLLSGLDPTNSIDPSIINEHLFLMAKTSNVKDIEWLLKAGTNIEVRDQ